MDKLRRFEIIENVQYYVTLVDKVYRAQVRLWKVRKQNGFNDAGHMGLTLSLHPPI